MTAGWVVSCEHASARVPDEVDLGLSRVDQLTHHAWDPGAQTLAAPIANGLGCGLLAGNVSRLVVDLNRTEENPEVVPAVSFGLPVPGNQDLDPAERERRLATYHRPYRAAVRGAVDGARRLTGRCLHLSIHSFVPILNGRRRDLEVGVLFDPDRSWEAEVAGALLEALRQAGWDARANQPYVGTDDGLTTSFRPCFPAETYAGIEIEASQGLLGVPGGLDRLARDVVRAARAAVG